MDAACHINQDINENVSQFTLSSRTQFNCHTVARCDNVVLRDGNSLQWSTMVDTTMVDNGMPNDYLDTICMHASSVSISNN